MLALQQYGGSDSEQEEESEKKTESEESQLHFAPLPEKSVLQTAICPTPIALPPVS